MRDGKMRMHADGQGGFTLLEIMVVLVIFSMIAVGSLSVLVNLLHTQKALEEQGARLEDLQRLLLMARHDISQTLPRQLPGAAPATQSGTQTGAQAQGYVTMPQNGPLLFIRGGWPNPLGEERSSLAYTSYSMTEGSFRQELWPFASYGAMPSSVSQRFASDALGMQLGAVQKGTDATTSSSRSTFPLGIDVTFTTTSFGDVHELIPLVGKP